MPLFATLANTEAFANQETSKRPAFPPTAVQLYVNQYISFSSYALVDTNTPSASNAAAANVPKRFEALSYQSSHLPESKNEFRTTKGGQPSLVAEEPNFGIWDCRCGGNGTSGSSSGNSGTSGSGNAAVMVATLLKRVLPPPSSPPIFLAVVDLAQPHQVQPMLSSMMSAIVEYTKKETTAKEPLSSELDSTIVQQGTTSPSRLTMMEFGKAPSTNETLPPLAEEGGESSTRSSHGASTEDLCIVLCAVLPPTKTNNNSNAEDVTYKEKQAQNLVRYHLFKYASQIQCTLAFVRHHDQTSNAVTVVPSDEAAEEQSPASKGTDAMEGISVQDLSIVIRRLSQNLPPMERVEAMVVEEESGSEGTQVDTAEQGTSPQPSIYAPGQYDTELIDSAYLRNASCPGVWNANEDDLTVALPPMTTTTTKGDTASGKEKTLVDTKRRGGDEEWLTRLADSVTAVPGGMMGDDAVSVIGGRSVRSGKTPAKDSKSSSTKKKVARKKPTSDNKDVSDFFNDLLAK
jgi:hypothetical protein